MEVTSALGKEEVVIPATHQTKPLPPAPPKGCFSKLDNKWLSFLCGLAMMSAAGTEYMFSTYAPQLKTLLGYTQVEINLLGTGGNMGISLGFYMGLINDYSNARVVSLLGALFLFLGWFLLYLGSTQTISSNYLLMTFFMFLQGTGSSACYTAAIANNLPKFSGKSRGTVVGLLVSMFGLTSAIFSPIYVHIFDSDVQSFLLFFSLFLPFISFLGVIFLFPPPPTPPFTPSPSPSIASPLLGDGSVQTNSYLPSHPPIEKAEKEEWKGIPIKTELNSLQIFCNVDFHLIFIIFMLAAGVGLTLFNNLGSLVLSMGGDSASALVTLLSICNCAGRAVFGFASDHIVKARSTFINRSFCLLLGLLLMALSEVYFTFITTKENVMWLSPGVIMMGLSYGSIMCITPTLVTEFLGAKYFGGNWGIVRFSPAVSGFLFSTLMAGYLYSLHVEGYGTENATMDCYGWECYGFSFIICFFILLFSILLCLVLIFRWHLFERSLRASKSPPL